MSDQSEVIVEFRGGGIRRAVLLAVLLVGVCLLGVQKPPTGQAAGVPLDPSFGRHGVVFSLVGQGGAAMAVAERNQGGLVAVGSDFSSVAYRRDGSPDLSFGEEGQVDNLEGGLLEGRALAIQPNGKIVIAGRAGEIAFALVRLNEDGKLDRSFGKRGSVRTETGTWDGGGLDVALQPSGDILAVGFGVNALRRWSGVVIRYRPDGTIDRSFGQEGKVKLHAPGKKVILVAKVEVLSSGKILLAGERAGRFFLMRLRADGKLDRDFGDGDGEVSVDADGSPCVCAALTGLAMTPSGKAVLAGSFGAKRGEGSVLLRFRPDGRLDRSFGGDGIVRTLRGSHLSANAVTVARHGRIVTTGAYVSPRTHEAQIAAVRYLPSGKLDLGFGRKGLYSRDLGLESVGYAATTQRDGRVVIAGRANRRPGEFPELEDATDNADYVLMRFLP